MNVTENRPAARVGQWYDQRVAEAAKKNEPNEKYEKEIARFNDSFERLSQLDGSEKDQNSNPGEVDIEGYSNEYLNFPNEVLRRTQTGFEMRTVVLEGEDWQIASSETVYTINPDSTVIEVTRNESPSHPDDKEFEQRFSLDTQNGLLLRSW